MKECFLCGRNGSADPLDMHHVFNGAYRKKSEKYGLVVLLCHERCHIFSKEAVHNNAGNMRRLRQWGQQLLMEKYGWTVNEFVKEFGKNYLD